MIFEVLTLDSERTISVEETDGHKVSQASAFQVNRLLFAIEL